MKQDPPLDAKCRDKFLVQSAPINSDQDFASIASVLESADKSQLTERKIRVNWLAASGEAAQSTSPPSGPLSTPSKASSVNGVRSPLTVPCSRIYPDKKKEKVPVADV